MKHSLKLLFACIPLVWLSACGGDDLQDRLDVADPAVRFVNASAGTHQLTITAAATKTVLYKGQLGFGDNKDILVVVVPDPAAPGASQALFKVEGLAGLIPVPAI